MHALAISIVIGLHDECETKFEKILTLSEFVVAANTSGHGMILPTFTCHQGIIGTLFFTARKAPSLAVRQRAVDLLSRTQGREGLWDSADAHCVAQKNLKVLQGDLYLMPGLVLLDSMDPAEANIWHDIGARLKSRMVLGSESSSQYDDAMADSFNTLPTSPSGRLTPANKKLPPELTFIAVAVSSADTNVAAPVRASTF